MRAERETESVLKRERREWKGVLDTRYMEKKGLIVCIFCLIFLGRDRIKVVTSLLFPSSIEVFMLVTACWLCSCATAAKCYKAFPYMTIYFH